ncbi:hypothetical protein B296_00010094 [Ensete ventricosum]|uniref:Uncharacterized protein n=1 Tax=Ensete ventricosum TaxID=4639 RepID=A0A427AM25_ENSVE|nr:hypothetical protein B296_00010094 [Ensete ventricosum]
MSQMVLCFVTSVSSWCPTPPSRQSETKFTQQTNKFWEFEEQSNTWVEINLPFDLMSCINDSCSKVGSIENMGQKDDESPALEQQQNITDRDETKEDYGPVLPLRRRISLTRMSEASVWVTGQSGSIYERFWNGVKWVIAPHELPNPTGQAVSVLIINQTILAVSEGGLLYQVALRKFQWKDCHNPPDTKIAFIVDQEAYRKNIIFVVGQNGRLYQYNRITELWHKHYQSPHLVLSRSPGTAIRPSVLSLAGSIFMISDNGGLVEYQWDSLDGWEWVEHGTPYRDVLLVGAPGPCFDDTQLFVIGSDGQVYRRHWDRRTWKWTCHGFPHSEPSSIEEDQRLKGNKNCATDDDDNVANHKNEAHYPDGYSRNCNEKLAELRRSEGGAGWEWARIIGTPTSLCSTSYWTAVAT